MATRDYDGLRRMAFKLFYTGEGLHGSQFQTSQPTVEGELWKAAFETELCGRGKPPGFQMAGRTDAGVSALGMVFSMNIGQVTGAIPRRLNSSLPPNIGVWASCPVHGDFSPRRDALRRTYSYFLYAPGLDSGLCRDALDSLLGEHDFRSLCRRERGRRTISIIEAVELDGTSPIFRLRFTAHGFLRQQVRRMVTAVKLVGGGVKDPGWINELLRRDYTGPSVAPSPPTGLFLENIEYAGLKWEPNDYAVKSIRARLKEMSVMSYVRAAALDEILKGI